MNNINQCALCNQPIPKNTGLYAYDEKVLLCNNCGAHYGRCSTCAYSKRVCGIQNYHGAEPLVRRERRVVNAPMVQMVTEQDVPNIQLIEKICGECVCGSMDNCKSGFCNNWVWVKEENNNDDK